MVTPYKIPAVIWLKMFFHYVLNFTVHETDVSFGEKNLHFNVSNLVQWYFTRTSIWGLRLRIVSLIFARFGLIRLFIMLKILVFRNMTNLFAMRFSRDMFV